MKQLYLIVVAVLFAGCAAMLPQGAKEKIATAVKTYCAQPYPTRMAMRADVNTLTSPNSVAVRCAGDPE